MPSLNPKQVLYNHNKYNKQVLLVFIIAKLTITQIITIVLFIMWFRSHASSLTSAQGSCSHRTDTETEAWRSNVNYSQSPSQ